MRELFKFTVNQLREMSSEPLPDSELVITRASSLGAPHPNSVMFIKRLTPELSANLKGRVADALILLPKDTDERLSRELSAENVIGLVDNPRLSFARIMNAASATVGVDESFVQVNGSTVARSVSIPDSVKIQPGCFIDHDVLLSPGVQILSGARICAYTEIGPGTIIRQNAVVGSQGFGFERDESGRPIRLPHFGGVILGANVEIGACTTVCSGTIDPTMVGDDVKIDNLVHIAHNCVIGRQTMIAACAELSGSVTVGECAWIAPNVSVLEGKQIGNRALLGLGAVVIRNVPDDDVVVGNPARSIRAIADSR